MSIQQLLDQRSASIDNLIANLGGIALTIGGEQQPVQFPDADGWQEVAAVPGLFIRPFLVPGCTDSDYLHNWGKGGVHMENGEVPQSCRFTVIAGAVLWRQQYAYGGQHVRLGPGDTATLQPHEKHSYVFLEDCFSLTVVTPPFAHHTPRPLL